MIEPARSWSEDYRAIARELGRQDDSGFLEWMAGKDYLGGRFFNGMMYARLYEIYKSVMFGEQDHFIVCTGGEGSGKSTLLFQVGAVLDPTLDASHICKNESEFMWWLRHGRPGQFVWLDEGVRVLFGREAMGKKRAQMVKLITLMRFKRLIVGIGIPEFKELDPKVRESRADTLLQAKKLVNANGRVYTSINKTGAKIFSKALKKGVPETQIKVPHGTFFNGYFVKRCPVINGFDWAGYFDRKTVDFDDFLDECENKKVKKPEGESREAREVKSVFVRPAQVYKALGIKQQTFDGMMRSGRVPTVEIGGALFIPRKWFEKVKNDADVPL